MVATTIAVISLACLVLSLSIRKQQTTNNSITVLLLTEGFNADSVKKFINKNAGTKIFATGKSIKAFNATYITDVTALQTLTNAKQLHIFGYGLGDNELALLENTQIIFHPSAIVNTITSINWTQYIASGEKLVVQGNYNNAASSPAKIVLTGFDTNLDSVTINPKQTSHFQLTAAPKHIGKAVYSISVLTGKDTLQKEPVPVEVKTIQPISILLLASSPDFENKFLKNWLAQNEYRIAVRTSISKSKYDIQYLNTSPVSLSRITSSLLEKTDVVIADVSELAALPASDIATIRSYVENKGMGLIAKADNTENTSAFYSKFFPLAEIRDSIRHRVKLNLQDTGISSFLKLEQPVYIRPIAGTQSLIRDQQMRIVTNSKMYGLGKIILTTIPNTFNWLLSGNNNDYTSYWSLLLKNSAKKTPLQEVWNIQPYVPVINEAVHVKLQTGNTGIPHVQTGKDVIYMKQHPNLYYEWEGTYWPAKTGWHSLINGENSTNWWYVYDNTNWKGVRASAKINATRKYAASQQDTSIIPSLQNNKATKVIPKIYFFIIFVVFAGFLWFEKKYRNG